MQSLLVFWLPALIGNPVLLESGAPPYYKLDWDKEEAETSPDGLLMLLESHSDEPGPPSHCPIPFGSDHPHKVLR